MTPQDLNNVEKAMSFQAYPTLFQLRELAVVILEKLPRELHHAFLTGIADRMPRPITRDERNKLFVQE